MGVFYPTSVDLYCIATAGLGHDKFKKLGGINLAKPDNRADNEVHLQQHIDHTIANLREAEDYLDEHAEELAPDEIQRIKAKNKRRKESIRNFIAEKKDEAQE
jgi:small acid-soluble spore protein (thioredoxin-like protein)